MGGGHVQGLMGARVLGHTEVKLMCDTGDNIAGIHETTMSTQAEIIYSSPSSSALLQIVSKPARV